MSDSAIVTFALIAAIAGITLAAVTLVVITPLVTGISLTAIALVAGIALLVPALLWLGPRD